MFNKKLYKLFKNWIYSKFVYFCTYCYWDTTEKKLTTDKETDLDNIIFQLKDTSSKGYMKKMYDHLVSKLKKNDQAITINKISESKSK